jgi:hypothetical protein
MGTIMATHGTITDSALLMLYLTYNLWMVASRTNPNITISSGASLLSVISQTTWGLAPKEPLLGVVGGLLNMFSVELVTTVLLQMAIFLIAARLYGRSIGIDEGEGNGDQPDPSAWLIHIVWPCFGKAILVAVYTHAWLMYTRQATLPAYFDPTVWRWVNIFVCILLYMYHLLNPVYDDQQQFYLHLD